MTVDGIYVPGYLPGQLIKPDLVGHTILKLKTVIGSDRWVSVNLSLVLFWMVGMNDHTLILGFQSRVTYKELNV